METAGQRLDVPLELDSSPTAIEGFVRQARSLGAVHLQAAYQRCKWKICEVRRSAMLVDCSPQNA